MGINLVPWYGSAYLRDGTAEKLRIDARGFDNAGRRQRRLALWPASRVIGAAIGIEEQEELGACDQTSSFDHRLEEGREGLIESEGRLLPAVMFMTSN